MNVDTLFGNTVLAVPEILIPAKTCDLKKWAVVACDQHTQNLGYWKRVEEFVGESPSALNIILPEIYLESEGALDRIFAIKAEMQKYLDGDVFAQPVKGFVYVERKTARGKTRKGLVCAVDLERYDWREGAKAEIRATEETIAQRLPPRMKIRRGAPLEIPHIMILADDPEKALVERAGELAKAESKGEPLYETELMEDSGSIAAWKLSDGERLAEVARALSLLAGKGSKSEGRRFLFAVGDGNHSLAAAKAVWEECKKNGAAQSHPARYALAEIVNLYDEGLSFEPIHRAVFGAGIDSLAAWIAAKADAQSESAPDFSAALEAVMAKKSGNSFALSQKGKSQVLTLKTAQPAALAVQPALDSFLQENAGASIDYIHGAKEAERLSKSEDAVAVLMPPLAKQAFFSLIEEKGSLPRKAFSLGEADEKRFYIECRKLF